MSTGIHRACDGPGEATVPGKDGPCCGQIGKKGTNLQCSRCKKVAYCSVECQRAHWKAHKVHCKKPAKALAAPTPDIVLEGHPEGAPWANLMGYYEAKPSGGPAPTVNGRPVYRLLGGNKFWWMFFSVDTARFSVEDGAGGEWWVGNRAAMETGAAAGNWHSVAERTHAGGAAFPTPDRIQLPAMAPTAAMRKMGATFDTPGPGVGWSGATGTGAGAGAWQGTPLVRARVATARDKAAALARIAARRETDLAASAAEGDVVLRMNPVFNHVRTVNCMGRYRLLPGEHTNGRAVYERALPAGERYNASEFDTPEQPFEQTGGPLYLYYSDDDLWCIGNGLARKSGLGAGSNISSSSAHAIGPNLHLFARAQNCPTPGALRPDPESGTFTWVTSLQNSLTPCPPLQCVSAAAAASHPAPERPMLAEHAPKTMDPAAAAAEMSGTELEVVCSTAGDVDNPTVRFIGLPCRIKGIKSQAQLNGTKGEVAGAADQATGRCHVVCHLDGVTRNLKLDCIEMQMPNPKTVPDAHAGFMLHQEQMMADHGFPELKGTRGVLVGALPCRGRVAVRCHDGVTRNLKEDSLAMQSRRGGPFDFNIGK